MARSLKTIEAKVKKQVKLLEIAESVSKRLFKRKRKFQLEKHVKHVETSLEILQDLQHDLTTRIYVLHKITIALKFMSYINQKLRPSYQTASNLCLT